MKSASAALKAHYSLPTRTIARLWRLERSDGSVVSLTNIDRDILYLGVLYRAAPGVTPTAFVQTADAAVANSEIEGVMSADSVREREIVAGLWDGALVTVLEVNYQDLSMGHMLIGVATIGIVKAGLAVFNAELRSLSQALQQVNGRSFTPHCVATLGDAECKVDVEAMRDAGSMTAVTSRRTFTDAANFRPSDWYGAGLVRIEDGDNAGFEMEVYSFAGGVFQLALPMPFNLVPGTAYSALPGCRKRHERGTRKPTGVSDCVDKFNNIANFRGFPPALFPGNNRILGLGSYQSTNYKPS